MELNFATEDAKQFFLLRVENASRDLLPVAWTVANYRNLSNTTYTKKILSILTFARFSGKGRQYLHYETSQNANFIH